jgi:hypothetical protein
MILSMAHTVRLPRHKIAPMTNVKALSQTGRENSTENGDKIDRIAGDRDVMRPHEVVLENAEFATNVPFLSIFTLYNFVV